MNTGRLNPLAALGAGTVALLLGIAAGAGSPAPVSAKPATPELCERYAGLPGAGPLRRADWFRDLWESRSGRCGERQGMAWKNSCKGT